MCCDHDLNSNEFPTRRIGKKRGTSDNKKIKRLTNKMDNQDGRPHLEKIQLAAIIKNRIERRRKKLAKLKMKKFKFTVGWSGGLLNQTLIVWLNQSPSAELSER